MTDTPLPDYRDLADFMAAYGGIYEHSPWIAERAFDAPEKHTVEKLHAALKHIVDGADDQRKLALIQAHPDLACAPGRLTMASQNEQSGAGLTHCSEEEYQAFQDLNRRYREKFGFPFIIAVRGLDRAEILARFRERIDHERSREFDTALEEIHKIAFWRLRELAQ